MSNLQFHVTGAVTTVKTNGGALVGYLVTRLNGDTTVIAGPGHGTGATYTSSSVALDRLLAGTGPTRSEREIENIG